MSRRARGWTAAWFILGAVPAFVSGMLSSGALLSFVMIVAVVPLFLARLWMAIVAAQLGQGRKAWVELDDLWTFEVLYWVFVLPGAMYFQATLLARIFAPESGLASSFVGFTDDLGTWVCGVFWPYLATVVSWTAMLRARRAARHARRDPSSSSAP